MKRVRKEEEKEEYEHLGEALQEALKPNSRQPIILQTSEYDMAYWPASLEAGFLFMKYLIEWRKTDRKKHCTLIYSLDLPDVDEKFLFHEKVLKVSELGKFQQVLYPHREYDEYATELECCKRSSLSAFLYQEMCYRYL